MCSDTGIATHGSKIPGYASLTSLFREEQKIEQLFSFLDNFGPE